MFEFTSLFLKKFIDASMNSLFSLNTMGTLESSGSFLPTTTSLSATETSNFGTELINAGNESDSTLGVALGTATTFTGTSVSINANSVYEETLEELKNTQAYIESLNEEELSEMIAKLEKKDIELSFQDHQYTKTL